MNSSQQQTNFINKNFKHNNKSKWLNSRHLYHHITAPNNEPAVNLKIIHARIAIWPSPTAADIASNAKPALKDTIIIVFGLATVWVRTTINSFTCFCWCRLLEISWIRDVYQLWRQQYGHTFPTRVLDLMRLSFISRISVSGWWVGVLLCSLAISYCTTLCWSVQIWLLGNTCDGRK